MNAIIVEDELPSSRKLERLIVKIGLNVLGRFTSVKDTVAWLSKNKHPDILFLDVQLSDGLCFDILEELSISSKIIFTTAFPKYSIKAFDFNGVSYLLKPIQEEKLKLAIEKAQKIRTKDKEYELLKKAFNTIVIANFKESFAVKVGKRIKIIDVKEIVCFYSYENATFAKTNKGNYIINHSLTSLETDLDPKLFFRVNRTFIVNINEIKDIISYTNSRLQLKLTNYDDIEIIVSRERVKDFKNWIA